MAVAACAHRPAQRRSMGEASSATAGGAPQVRLVGSGVPAASASAGSGGAGRQRDETGGGSNGSSDETNQPQCEFYRVSSA